MRWRSSRALAGVIGVVALAAGGATRAASPREAAALAAAADGGLELRVGGAVVARIPVKTPALRRGPARLREVTVEDHRLVEVRVPIRGAANEELWLAELRGQGQALGARVVWSGLAGARDADGEVAIDVEVTPDEVLEYQTSSHVSRCDGVAARLFPRAFDFDAGRFRPVTSPLPPAAPEKLVARRGDPAMPKDRPVGTFHFSAASTTPAAGSDARDLAAPAALDDGDPATAWTEGLGGDGRGEFLTARSGAGGYAIRGVRFLPGDAASAQRFRARNRVRRFQLSFGPRAQDRFDVELPEDPGADAARFRDAYWVALPRPIVSSCVTLVITEVASGTEASPPKTFGATALSEVTIFTELDGPEGALRLVADVTRSPDCASRVPTLVGLGTAALLPTAQALMSAVGAAGAAPRARGSSRGCLVEALTRLDPAPKNPIVVEALVAAVAGATDDEERLLAAALGRAAEPPVAALVGMMNAATAPVPDRARAARLLGAFDDAEAAASLLTAVGHGPTELRLAVSQSLARSARLEPAALFAAIDRAATEGAARQADLLRVVPAAAKRLPGGAAASLPALHGALEPARAFEVRGRAVVALGALGPAALPELVEIGAHADEPVLRHLAARELAALGGAEALAALRAALADGDPRVRETAAQGLGEKRDRVAGAALVAGAKQEPWPFVRRAELEALGHLCVPGAGDLLARAVERDVDEVRRAALVGLARCQDARAQATLMHVLGRRNEASTLRELAAALLGERRDRAVAPGLAAALARQISESEADLSVEGVAAATLRALARLGGPEATASAVRLATDARHPFRQTAIEALGTLCDPGAGAVTLRALEAGADSSLAVAAQNASKRCAAR
jgi:HEAT repeat protein